MIVKDFLKNINNIKFKSTNSIIRNHFICKDGSLEQTPLPVIMQRIMEKESIDCPIFSANYFTAKSLRCQ